MRITQEGNHIRHDFDSIAEIAQVARDSSEPGRSRGRGYDGKKSCYHDLDGFGGYEFFHVRNHKELNNLVQNGWEEHADSTYQVAEETLKSVAREYDMPSFQSYYDVTGSDVDVDRFLSGEPENMIAYHMVSTPKAGRVITIVSNIAVNAMTSTKKMIARGKAVAALVMAIESLGLRTELFVEMQNDCGYGFKKGSYTLRQVTKVKSPEDTLDASLMLFGFAHPGFFRSLSLGAMWALPKELHDDFGVGYGHGHATNDLGYEDAYPEGTIHIPSSLDIDNPRGFVVEHLTGLGII
jgi:hypothetical protein